MCSARCYVLWGLASYVIVRYEFRGRMIIHSELIGTLLFPALATVSIFTFLWFYNDLFMQKTLIRDETVMPICAILDCISSQYGTDYGLMAVAVIVVVIPI